ncbi:hypothetical protein QQ020_27555 [Fulvivirgaceae bacterium BMA12]|uniref:Uncharacterized protein n=1 Tax=Agaribacillus aureus TaxID=3051825 RepID=A0ABT8LF82_9BACT|nr:hypothetical protein [Fulvivirgaceae bacterium BMA12]
MEIRERDYMMRQFRQLAIVLARLMGFKESNDHESALSLIEDSYKDILDLDLKSVKAMSSQELLDYLLKKKNMDLPSLEKVGELLMEEAYLYGNDSASDLFFSRGQKALYLLNYVQDHDQTFSLARKTLIDRLQKKLAGIN